ncbi:STAS domain-containing protein [Sphingomonas sp. KRR8]|uniref:STAS domain-containing protein n=1 Tax=Sphingomonas sp. KRR8 TaxID=2942996 RepID=UPI0020218E6D|nr:STAS domain-containing protein [Sphingomonas sp. KRR8]URD61926.1 STAS domain-containing protein [Sphingomonas sp. KRR8]
MSSPLSPLEPLVLPANGNLAAAEALLPQVQAAAASGIVSIDAGEVSTIGQAMLQLLLAAARSRAGLHITAASDAFRERIEQLGLKELAA